MGERPAGDDFDAIAGRYLDGLASPAEVARLDATLADDPAARRAFLELCEIDSALAERAVEWREGDDEPAHRRPAARPLAFTALAASVAIGLAAWLQGRWRSDPAGQYDNRSLPVVTVATVHGDADRVADRPIPPTTLRAGPPATSLKSVSGADIDLLDKAVFGMSAADEGALYGGGVQARLADPAARFSVTAANLRVVDLGTAFRVERIDDEHVAVTVLDGEVEVQSRVRLPVCHWSFDDVRPADGSRRTHDAVAGFAGELGAAVAVVPGIVGSGALRFDDTRTAVVRIVGGTAEKVGQGTLSMREGISIEAVIVPGWTGAERDYDEIYRKEDGDCRVLLSFQNDGSRHAAYSEPAVARGPCLSFGLHLADRGYRELDMPLDGRDGRPTVAELTDGRPHHVVATYDSFTGRKAVFIDGRKRFEQRYPVGTLMLSGGPAVAEIGNTRGSEPFRGVIDEFALYDFALTEAEIAEHHRRAVAGEHYFGAAPPAAGGPRWQAVTRLGAGRSMTFNQQTGLPR